MLKNLANTTYRIRKSIENKNIMEIYYRLSELLADVESELKNVNHWSDRRPMDEAFQSEQPFFVDTMDFPQWLQYVFLERIRSLVDGKLTLPDSCGVAPMAEEYFRSLPINANQLILTLKNIDDGISNRK